jgi:flagellar hook-associated protein 3 FlgL
MTAAQNQNTDSNTNMTDVLSKTKNVDITKVIMEYATAQTVYLASLQTSAKIIEPTLMDYIR